MLLLLLFEGVFILQSWTPPSSSLATAGCCAEHGGLALNQPPPHKEVLFARVPVVVSLLGHNWKYF
jgi:hypothetical protein